MSREERKSNLLIEIAEYLNSPTKTDVSKKLRKIIDEYIELGGKINDTIDDEGKMPFICCAVVFGNTEAVKILATKGADISVKYEGMTLIECARFLEREEIARFLEVRETVGSFNGLTAYAGNGSSHRTPYGPGTGSGSGHGDSYRTPDRDDKRSDYAGHGSSHRSPYGSGAGAGAPLCPVSEVADLESGKREEDSGAGVGAGFGFRDRTPANKVQVTALKRIQEEAGKGR